MLLLLFLLPLMLMLPPPPCRSGGEQAQRWMPPTPGCRNQPVLQLFLFLCLSRACLGKMVGFQYKMTQNGGEKGWLRSPYRGTRSSKLARQLASTVPSGVLGRSRTPSCGQRISF